MTKKKKETPNNTVKVTVLTPTEIETDYEMNLAMLCCAARQNGGELLFRYGAWKMKLTIIEE